MVNKNVGPVVLGHPLPDNRAIEIASKTEKKDNAKDNQVCKECGNCSCTSGKSNTPPIPVSPF